MHMAAWPRGTPATTPRTSCAPTSSDCWPQPASRSARAGVAVRHELAEDRAGPQQPWRFGRRLLPIGFPAAALAAAVIGALLTDAHTGGVTGGVERLSSSSGGYLTSLSNLLPLGYAFGAGMVSAVHPCGFPMLPAYLGFYLGESEDGPARPTRIRPRLARALLVSASVTAGFVLLFAGTGLLISGGAQALSTAFPWIGLAVGLALVGAGAWMLSGRAIYSALGARTAARIGGTGQANVRGYFPFGVSYGVASLSCTLPIVPAAAGGSLAVSNLPSAFAQFVLYGLGMGAVIAALTLSTAACQAASPPPLPGSRAAAAVLSGPCANSAHLLEYPCQLPASPPYCRHAPLRLRHRPEHPARPLPARPHPGGARHRRRPRPHRHQPHRGRRPQPRRHRAGPRRRRPRCRRPRPPATGSGAAARPQPGTHAHARGRRHRQR